MEDYQKCLIKSNEYLNQKDYQNVKLNKLGIKMGRKIKQNLKFTRYVTTYINYN